MNLSLRRFVTVASAVDMKLTKAVPTIEQSGMYVQVPKPVSAIDASSGVSSS